MKYICFLFFTTIMLMASCKDDAEHELANSLPKLATGPVSDLDNSGVTFVGTLDHVGTTPIVDHGFIWGPAYRYNSDTRKQSMGKLDKKGDFTYRATAEMRSGEQYYVKTYAETSDFKVYGDSITFISQGSAAPVVDRVVPSVVSIYSERLVIYGKNFCKSIYDAGLPGANARILSISPDSAVIRVYESKVGVNELKLKVFDKFVTISYIAEPVSIEFVTSQPVPIGATLSFTGKHLSHVENGYIIDADGIKYGTSWERTDSEIKFTIPILVEGSVNLLFHIQYPGNTITIPLEIISPWKINRMVDKMPVGIYHPYQGNLYVMQDNILYKFNAHNQEVVKVTEHPNKSYPYTVLDFILGNKFYFCIPDMQKPFMSYDITTGIWEELSPATDGYHPRYRSFVIGEKAYACFLDVNTGFDYLWSFDPQTNIWTKLQKVEDIGHWVSVVGDKAYFFLYQDVLIFDSSTQIFERKSLPLLEYGFGSMYVHCTDNQKIYIALNTLLEYDPVSNQMKELPQTWSSRSINAMFAFNGKIYEIYDNGNKCLVASVLDLLSYL